MQDNTGMYFEELVASIVAAAGEVRETPGIFENIRSTSTPCAGDELPCITLGVVFSNTYFDDNRCLFNILS